MEAARLLRTLTPSIESAGVDWLTATARRCSANQRFRDLAEQLVESEAREGNETRKLRSYGLAGWSSGGASYGVRWDVFYCQLRSDLARSSWREVAALADNVSRIDLQLTARLPRAYPRYFTTQYKQAIKARTRPGRPSEVELRLRRSGASMVTCGVRDSDLYGRVYDKGVEAKSDAPGNLIRFEVEAKRRLAKQYATKLNSTEGNEAQVIGTVARYFSNRGLVGLPDAYQFCEVLTARYTDDSRRIKWLASSVAPAIQGLLSRGKGDEVIHALTLCDALGVNCSRCTQTKAKE